MRRVPPRVALALQPTCRGFGFAVLDLTAKRLISWALREVVREEMDQRALPLVAKLIEYYSPNIVIVEDIDHLYSKRRGRGRALVEGIVEVADTMHVAVGRIPSINVRRHYRELGALNKDARAQMIVKEFPELRSVLPPLRNRIWLHQSDRMAVFDSVAFALVFSAVNPSIQTLRHRRSAA